MAYNYNHVLNYSFDDPFNNSFSEFFNNSSNNSINDPINTVPPADPAFTTYPTFAFRKGTVCWNSAYYGNSIPITYDRALQHWLTVVERRTINNPLHIVSMDDGGLVPVPAEFDEATKVYLGPCLPIIAVPLAPNLQRGNRVALPTMYPREAPTMHQRTTVPTPVVYTETHGPATLMQDPGSLSRLSPGAHPAQLQINFWPVLQFSGSQGTVPVPRSQRLSTVAEPIVIDDAESIAIEERNPAPCPPKKPSYLQDRTKFLGKIARGQLDSWFHWWTTFQAASYKHKDEYCRKYWQSDEAALTDVKRAALHHDDFEGTRMYRLSNEALKTRLSDASGLDKWEELYEEMMATQNEKLKLKAAKDKHERIWGQKIDLESGRREHREEKKRRSNRVQKEGIDESETKEKLSHRNHASKKRSRSIEDDDKQPAAKKSECQGESTGLQTSPHTLQSQRRSATQNVLCVPGKRLVEDSDEDAEMDDGWDREAEALLEAEINALIEPGEDESDNPFTEGAGAETEVALEETTASRMI